MEGVSLLFVGIGVVLVFNAIMQERLPEVEGLIVTLQQALKGRNEWGHQKVVLGVNFPARGRAAR